MQVFFIMVLGLLPRAKIYDFSYCTFIYIIY